MPDSSFVKVLYNLKDRLEACFGVFLVKIALSCSIYSISKCGCPGLGVLNDEVKIFLFDELLHDDSGLRYFDTLD